MEGIDFGFGVLMLLFLVLGIGFVIFISDSVFNSPIASETAKQECIAQGFDYVKAFRRVPFSTQPLGIECGIVGYEKVFVDIENGIPIETR